MEMFVILIVVMAPWVYTCVKTYQIVHFKYMQLIICQLYLNKLLKDRRDQGAMFCSEFIMILSFKRMLIVTNQFCQQSFPITKEMQFSNSLYLMVSHETKDLMTKDHKDHILNTQVLASSLQCAFAVLNSWLKIPFS